MCILAKIYCLLRNQPSINKSAKYKQFTTWVTWSILTPIQSPIFYIWREVLRAMSKCEGSIFL